MSTDALQARLARLSPEQRALVLQKLRTQQREDGAGTAAVSGAVPAIPRARRDAPLPLSFAQARLWFLDRLEGESSDYRVRSLWQLTGRLNVAALTQSLTAIVARHEVLRTTFRGDLDTPVQIIQAPQPVALPVFDLRAVPAAEQQEAAQRLAAEESRRPFDLARGPLLRTALFQLGTDSHALLLVMHHILCDGWSMSVLRRELAAHYTALCAGVKPTLPELPIQYADFALWQRQRMQGPALATALAHFRQQLDGAPPLLELPTDRSRPTMQTFRGGALYFSIDQALTGELRRLGQEVQATLFMTLLAAFALLLSRYSALLAQVQQTALGAYTHQDLPFEKLVDELQPTRSLSHNPLFQVMFALQSDPVAVTPLPELTLTPLLLDNVTTHFDLSLTLKETADGLLGEWEYSSDLFDADTIAGMVEHYQTLLRSIVRHPEQPVGTLPMLSTTERHQLLVGRNATQAVYPLDRCIHQLFEDHVARNPDAIAVLQPGAAALTYGELDARANQLARHLQTLGVGPDTLVGLCIARSSAMLVGLLGILKAGGAYVPLDPDYPTERLAYTIKDARIRIAVTQQQQLAALTSLSTEPVHVVCLDSQWTEIARQSAEPLPCAAQAANLVYVIYTSGSSGTPKGVMIEHRALANFVQADLLLFGLSPQDRCLQFTTLNFDTAAEEIFPCLCSGATLILSTDEMRDSVHAFIHESQAHQVTQWTLAAAYWDMLCGELCSSRLTMPPTVRLVNIGGERVVPERVRQWVKRFGAYPKLMNVYGPTETTCFATTSELSALSSLQLAAKEVPIGRPIGNTQVYVLDERLQPVWRGAMGELYIGGASLARGYLHRPELTRERFIPDPFSSEPGARLYKTGDMVRYRADGNLEFLCRMDGQVKIRGFRVELGEIEAVLLQHTQVAQAVVIARGGVADAGTQHLLAYVVAKNSQLSAAELQQFLKQQLPPYMMPSAITLLKALPLNANSKIDHRALPDPELAAASVLGSAFIPPAAPVEQQLAALWAEVLRLPRVGRHDNFFTLGGDSILSIQLVSRATSAGFPITAKQIFLHQTIAELAAALELAAQAPTAQPPQAEQGLVTGAVPLTPIQQVFFEVPQRNPHFYNLSVMLKTPTQVQPELLQQVVHHLLAHHDALRLRFVQQNGVWQQCHADLPHEVPFSVIDLSQVPPAEQAAAQRAADLELLGSLHLTAGPIVRVALVLLGKGQPGRLIFIVHHLAMDIVSWWVLIADLLRGYEQLRQGQAVQLLPKTTSFKDWACRMVAHAQSGDVRAELDYWLAATPSYLTPLPVDFPPSADNNVFVHMDRVYLDLPEADTQVLLQELPARYGTQINDVLLTAFVQTFADFTHQRAQLIELSNHGREALLGDTDLARTVGWFVSAYPIILTLSESADPRDSLQQIKAQLRRVPKQGVGYGLLRYLSEDPSVRQQLQSQPVAQVTFTYFGQSDKMLQEYPQWEFSAEDRPSFYSPLTERGQYLFNVHGVVMAGRLRISWTYSKRIHHRATVVRLAEGMFTHLAALINDPGTKTFL